MSDVKITMISVVIPVYECADCLNELYKRLRNCLLNITSYFEIIFVDDRGRDGAWEIISTLAKKDNTVKGIRLSRNFGQHLAITAGLAQSHGDWVVVMDCDLQDAPEEIIRLYDVAKSGFDIVLARRKQKKHSYARRILSMAYSKLMTLATKQRFDPELGGFSIISRKVVDSYLKFKDNDRHYLFILYWLGFDIGYINYEHFDRLSGKSSYTFRALIKHAISGMLFQTSILLKLIVYLGFFISGLGFYFSLYIVYRYYFYQIMPGWSSLAVLNLLIGGFIISSLGVVSLYIAKIFEQVKNRPLYIIDESI